MVELKNMQVFGLQRAVRAIANSYGAGEIDTLGLPSEANRELACRLGSDMSPHQSHDSFLKGVVVQFDMKGNGAFMPEFQRYHFAEIIMSQSTMHALARLLDSGECFTKYVDERVKRIIRELMEAYEKDRTYENLMRVCHNLPRGLELWCTVSTNYLQLKTICIQRKGHRMQEDWGAFRKACLEMPMFMELTGINE